MPLLILLLNYLSVERVAPYVAALQEILERDPTLLHVIRLRAINVKAWGRVRIVAR